MRVILGFVLGLVVLPMTAQADCYRALEGGQVLTGVLGAGRFEGARGQLVQAYILNLDAPACLSSKYPEDERKAEPKAHIYSADNAVMRKIRQLRGKKVRVVGEPFASATIHHQAPIVVLVERIEEVK